MEQVIVILGFLIFTAYMITVSKYKSYEPITTAVPGLKYEHIDTGTKVLVVCSSCVTTIYIMNDHEYEMSTATFMNEFNLAENEHTVKD